MWSGAKVNNRYKMIWNAKICGGHLWYILATKKSHKEKWIRVQGRIVVSFIYIQLIVGILRCGKSNQSNTPSITGGGKTFAIFFSIELVFNPGVRTRSARPYGSDQASRHCYHEPAWRAQNWCWRLKTGSPHNATSLATERPNTPDPGGVSSVGEERLMNWVRSRVSVRVTDVELVPGNDEQCRPVTMCYIDGVSIERWF